jgi:hypothetical protein
MSIPAVRPLRDLLRAFTGPALWFAHFTVVYGAEALICRAPSPAGARVMIVFVASATAVAIAALGAFAWSLMRRRAPHGFLRTIALALAALSTLGVTWTTLPALWLPACATPAG